MVRGVIPGTAGPASSLHRLPHSTANATPLARLYPSLPPWNTVLPVLQLMRCCHSWAAACGRRFSAMASQVATALQSPPQAEMAVAGATMAAGILPDSPLTGFVSATSFTKPLAPQAVPVAYIDSVVERRAMVHNGASRRERLGPLTVSLDHNYKNGGMLQISVVQFNSLGTKTRAEEGFDRTTREPDPKQKPTESFTLASAPFTPPTITIGDKSDEERMPDGTMKTVPVYRTIELRGSAEQRRMMNGSEQTVYVYKATVPVKDLERDAPIVIETDTDRREVLLERTRGTVNAQAQLSNPSRDTIL